MQYAICQSCNMPIKLPCKMAHRAFRCKVPLGPAVEAPLRIHSKCSLLFQEPHPSVHSRWRIRLGLGVPCGHRSLRCNGDVDSGHSGLYGDVATSLCSLIGSLHAAGISFPGDPHMVAAAKRSPGAPGLSFTSTEAAGPVCVN